MIESPWYAGHLSLLYHPGMIDEYEAFGDMRIGRGNWRTRRNPAILSLCSPHILYVLTWNRTRTAAVGIRRLTSWAMARPDKLANSPQRNKWKPNLGHQTLVGIRTRYQPNILINCITTWNRALVQKLIVVQILKEFPERWRSEGSLPSSQKPAIRPYPGPDESTPHLSDSCL
jgi:hypothetical protein